MRHLDDAVGVLGLALGGKAVTVELQALHRHLEVHGVVLGLALAVALLELQLGLLKLKLRVLSLLLGDLLRGHGLVHRQRALGRCGHQRGEVLLVLGADRRGVILVQRRERHAQGHLDLGPVRERRVLGHVRHERSHHLLRHRVLADDRHDLRVLHERLVRGDVCLVVLVREGLDRLGPQHVHVLGDGVLRLPVLGQLDDLVGVLDPQHLQHLPVQPGQVVDLRGLL